MNIDNDGKEMVRGRYDEATRELVARELRHSHLTRCLSIQVEVADGVVTLRGGVPDTVMRDVAGRVARHVPGVRAIVNEIEIVHPPAGE